MSVFGDILAGLKGVALLDYRVTELTRRIEALEMQERDTRDRLARVEAFIDFARGEPPRRLR